MSIFSFKLKNKGKGTLSAGITASDLTILLNSGDGATFPQPLSGSATSSGSATTLNSTGIGSSGVAVNDVIMNTSDGSYAIVVSVSTNSITTTRLLGGSSNTWASGNGWAVGWFTVTLAKVDGSGNDTAVEISLVSARSTDTLTVPTGGRGYDGTTAQDFSAGDRVELRVVAAHVEEIKKMLAQVQKSADSTQTTAAAAVPSADLASTAHSKGASLVGVEDSGGNFAGADVEAVLAELQANILAAVVVPTGGLLPYGGASAPAGWLLCDGSAISRATYAALFAVLGTAYGAGNGTTTFNLPDLRGRVPVGVDGGAGHITANNARGNTGGNDDGTHQHTIQTRTANSAGGAGLVWGAIGHTDDAGVLPPYQVVQYIIKT